MDREKLKRANEIMTEIAHYNELLSNLKSADCVDVVKINGRPVITSLYRDGNTTAGLFAEVIGVIATEVIDRKNRLEDEFDRL